MEQHKPKSLASQTQPYTLENLSNRVNKFLTEKLNRMKTSHFENRNTVFYHSCCNAFTNSRNKSSQNHTKRVTLFEFFGREGKDLDIDAALKVCCQQSQNLGGALHLSTPTYNTHHQEYEFLAKRSQDVEQKAAAVTREALKRITELEKKLVSQEAEIQALKKQATAETERAEQHLLQCIVYADWLRYNNVDPQKVRELWYPPTGHPTQHITVAWPDYYNANRPAVERVYKGSK